MVHHMSVNYVKGVWIAYIDNINIRFEVFGSVHDKLIKAPKRCLTLGKGQITINNDEMPAASPRNNEFENFIESLVANFNLKRVS